MKRWLFLCGGILTLMVAVACASSSPTPAPPAKPPGSTSPPAALSPRPQSTIAAGPGATRAATVAVARLSADGRLSFVDHKKLTFGTSGKISEIKVSELDRVTKGQALARLDTSALEQSVKTAEFGVKAAEMVVKSAEMDRQQAEYSVKSAEADLKQSQDNVKSAGIDLEQARDNFRKITYPYSYSTFAFDVPQATTYISDARRQIEEAQKGLQAGLTADQYNAATRQLQQALESLNKGRELLARGQGEDVFQMGALAVKDFWTLRAAQLAADKAQMAVQTALNAVNKTTLSVQNTRNLLNKAQLAVDRARNDLDKTRNDLDRARDELAKATIVAPIDGIVARVNSKAGDLLSAGNFATTVAIEVIDPRRMELGFKVNELDIPAVKVGQKVSISVDALPETRISGVVTSISSLPLAEGSVVSFEVKTVFDVPQNSALRAGMGARADIGLPDSAVLR